jgi:hypothetical protein
MFTYGDFPSYVKHHGRVTGEERAAKQGPVNILGFGNQIDGLCHFIHNTIQQASSQVIRLELGI